MTLKAVEILHSRHPEAGFFLMSEAASIDKQMHALDYDRALGELLELDDTIKATLAYLEEIGELDDTLVVVTADHGHGFDVMGNVDTKWLNEKEDPRDKRKSIGIYEQSGLSAYLIANSSAPVGSDQNLVYGPGVHFPANWDPRYTFYQGVTANPDRRENYQVHKNGPRVPALNVTGFDSNDYYVNYVDAVTGFVINGTLPVAVSSVQMSRLNKMNANCPATGRPRCPLPNRRTGLLSGSVPRTSWRCLQQHRHLLLSVRMSWSLENRGPLRNNLQNYR